MKTNSILFCVIFFFINTTAYPNSNDCTQFKKLSAKYIECTTKELKKKTSKNVKLSKKKFENSEIKDKLNKFKGSKTLSDLIKD